MTPSLREVQKTFAAAVYENAPALLAHVRAGTFSATRHVQIYRHNTFANLTDALSAVYRVVQRLVGERFFEHMAEEFIRRHPPRSGNLHDFGAQLPDFLTHFEPARDLAYLPDVARLEWAWHETFHAAEAALMPLAALAAVTPARYAGLVFTLHPSARLVASGFPILRIWETNQDGYDGDSAVNLDQGPERLLIVRRGLDVQIEPLASGDDAMLRAFDAGQTLAEASRAALAAQPAFDLADALRRHVATGTVTGFVDS